jgi:hypothetical protein
MRDWLENAQRVAKWLRKRSAGNRIEQKLPTALVDFSFF